MTQKLTMLEIATAYEVSVTVVKRWRDSGAPFILKNPTRVDPLALHRWLYEQGESTDPIPPQAMLSGNRQ